MKTEELNKLWQKEVLDKSKSVDPHDDYCWKSMCIGWAIAKGLSPSKAKDFERQVTV